MIVFLKPDCYLLNFDDRHNISMTSRDLRNHKIWNNPCIFLLLKIMLKWLVQRIPDPNGSTVEETITDDPVGNLRSQRPRWQEIQLQTDLELWSTTRTQNPQWSLFCQQVKRRSFLFLSL